MNKFFIFACILFFSCNTEMEYSVLPKKIVVVKGSYTPTMDSCLFLYNFKGESDTIPFVIQSYHGVISDTFELLGEISTVEIMTLNNVYRFNGGNIKPGMGGLIIQTPLENKDTVIVKTTFDLAPAAFYPAGFQVEKGAMLYEKGYITSGIACMLKAVYDDPYYAKGYKVLAEYIVKTPEGFLNQAIMSEIIGIYQRGISVTEKGDEYKRDNNLIKNSMEKIKSNG